MLDPAAAAEVAAAELEPAAPSSSLVVASRRSAWRVLARPVVSADSSSCTQVRVRYPCPPEECYTLFQIRDETWGEAELCFVFVLFSWEPSVLQTGPRL